MRSLTILMVICIALFATAEKQDGSGHKTTVRVKPGVISKLLGSKPTSISVDGYGKKQNQKRPALLSRYPVQADSPEPIPENQPAKQENKPNSDPYTFFPQRPIYPAAQPYPQPYPYPVPYPQPQPLPPQIPPYQGYPPIYPGYPQYPVYPNYPQPIYPGPYPSKFPYPYPGYPPYMGYPGGYPGYPLLSEPGDQTVTPPAAASQNPDQVGEVVENPEIDNEANEDNEIDPYVRKPKPTIATTTTATPSSTPSILPSVVASVTPPALISQ